MNLDEVRRLYQAGLADRMAPAPEISVEQLEALAAHRLPEAEALALLDRVMADEGLRREYELLRSIHEAGRVLPPLRRWAPLAFAATLLLAVGGTYLVQRARVDGVDPVRGPGSAVELVAPAEAAVVSLPATFTWRSVEGVVRYRVEMLDGAGVPVLAQETSDTSVIVPAGAAGANAEYRWWVEASFPSGATRSPMRTVVLTPP